MKVQAIVDVEVYNKDKDYCDMLCPYIEVVGMHCKCHLSGKPVRLSENLGGDCKRSSFCKKHQSKERGPTVTFVKSFLSN